MSKTKYCKHCTYFLKGKPNICNAFHQPTEDKTDCHDYELDQKKYDAALHEQQMIYEEEKVRQFLSRACEFLNDFTCKTGLRPKRIAVSYEDYRRVRYIRNQSYSIINNDPRVSGSLIVSNDFYIPRYEVRCPFEEILGVTAIPIPDVEPGYIGVIVDQL